MASDEQKRAFVASLYPGPRWAARVKHMSDAQVFAIYMQKKNEEQAKQAKEEDKNDEIPF